MGILPIFCIANTNTIDKSSVNRPLSAHESVKGALLLVRIIRTLQQSECHADTINILSQ